MYRYFRNIVAKFHKFQNSSKIIIIAYRTVALCPFHKPAGMPSFSLKTFIFIFLQIAHIRLRVSLQHFTIFYF